MITFRPYQSECMNAFYNYYASGRGGHGLIVVPTAGGKSLILGGLATDICRKWPGQRILILSHVQELIAQNYEKTLLCWPEAPAGIYSAALKQREHHKDIVVATIQSVYNKAHLLGWRDLCFIDEAHLIQFGSMGIYNQLIQALLAINPNMRICGFTATDYRLDGGMLTEGKGSIFNDTIIEIPIKRLLAEGYLTMPVSKSSLVQADMEGVRKTAGEFNIKQMAARFDQKAFINAALDSDMPYLQDRRSIGLFCATIENAIHVAEGMLARGIDCEVIDGKLSKEDRDDKFERFRSGELRALASVGVMTTGTDIPNIDAIVAYRATASGGLYQQIVGRGFRVMYAPGLPLDTAEQRLAAIAAGPKPNFLFLDHGGNVERHGPIIHVEKPKKKEKGEKASVSPLKARICKICRDAWPLDMRVCKTCGHTLVVERDMIASLSIAASTADIMGSAFQRGEVAQWFDVDDVRYSRHIKPGAPPSIKVTYYSGILQFDEYVRIDMASGRKWWSVRTAKNYPKNMQEAFSWIETLKKPLRVQVAKRDKFYEVLRHGFQPATERLPDSRIAESA